MQAAVSYPDLPAKNINDIVDKSKSKSNSGFKEWVREIIKKNLNLTEEEFKQLGYEDDKLKPATEKKIEKLLMLFNIEVCNQMNKRFIFNADGGWSIEHIYAQNSDNIGKDKRDDWLNKYKERVVMPMLKNETDTARIKKLEEIRNKIDKNNKDDFEELFNDIITAVESPGADIDNISNFALISKNDNSALSNSAFYEKREKIIRMIEEGKNIPQGTIYVFMKFYSGIGTNLDYWSADDGNAYVERLIKLLKNYFLAEGQTNG